MKTPIYKLLYFWVLTAIVAAILVGYLAPETAQDFKPLGDDFIKLIKFIIAPIIFLTVVAGIAGVNNAASVGRVGLKAMVYFETLSTFALAIGLAVALIWRPGSGFNIDPATLSLKDVSAYVEQSKHMSSVDFISNIIPTSIIEPFLKGDILQVLFLAILFGFALLGLGEIGRPMREFIDQAAKVVFGMLNMVMKLAPLGAFGAMAYVVGHYGVESLIHLGELIFCFYLTAILFVVVVLGTVAHITGFSIFNFLYYIKEELLIVLGTSSSETALAPLMDKLTRIGCSKQVVGLVVPAGYSFNLDGTNIYMTLAALFIAQATNTELTALQLATVLGVAMLTSKGASGVTGSGFIILAATIASVPDIPLGGMTIIFAIDKFMSECRALTNIVGNGVAAIVVSRWEGELDVKKMRKGLHLIAAETAAD